MSTADPPPVTVVVPTRDRPEMLEACLDALLATRPAPAEIIVVDSASRRVDAVAAARSCGVTVLRCHLPGASRARNAGWQAASQPIVAFVDDDVRVTADWVERIAAPFEDPEVALVTGGVAADERSVGRAVATTDEVPTGTFDRSHVGNVGASANLAVRRRVLDATGGFDELLGAGGRFRAAEDLDLFDRALRHGTGWHAADARATHRQWRDRRELLRLELSYGIGFGARLVKLYRTEPARARSITSYEIRRLGRDLAGDLRSAYRFGVISRLAWTIGSVRGLLTALPLRVRSGMLRSSRG